MRISIKPNSGQTAETVPYFAQVEFETLTIDLSNTLHVPVKARLVDGQTVYYAEACGYRTPATILADLPHQLDLLLRSLIATHRLPSYAFIARDTRAIYLVYTIGREVVVRVPGGPAFRHVELAKVRQFLTDYLHDSGELGTPGRPDKLHVRGIHRKSLALIRPIFYLKKRVPGETEFWAPVFQSHERGSIYTFAANNKREVFFADGKEVLNLHTIVSEVLITDERLQDPFDLRPDRLFSAQWSQLRRNLTPQIETIVAGDKKLAVYQNGRYYLALEERTEEDRYGLFMGEQIEDIRRYVGERFSQRGLINDPDAARISLLDPRSRIRA